MYQGSPDYQQMISLETSGDLIERHLDIPDKCGDALVMGKLVSPGETHSH